MSQKRILTSLIAALLAALLLDGSANSSGRAAEQGYARTKPWDRVRGEPARCWAAPRPATARSSGLKLLYRSNQLSKISPGDLKKIAALGLKNEYDLRTAEERAEVPDELPPWREQRLAERPRGLRPERARATREAPAASPATQMPHSAAARSKPCSSRATASLCRCRARDRPTASCSSIFARPDQRASPVSLHDGQGPHWMGRRCVALSARRAREP